MAVFHFSLILHKQNIFWELTNLLVWFEIKAFYKKTTRLTPKPSHFWVLCAPTIFHVTPHPMEQHNLVTWSLTFQKYYPNVSPKLATTPRNNYCNFFPFLTIWLRNSVRWPHKNWKYMAHDSVWLEVLNNLFNFHISCPNYENYEDHSVMQDIWQKKMMS